ncbi:MAG: DNA translocase FtsK [Chitinivibrionales bacterium]|nr:DNA translocase FtsK [Chitinivibrionales bacterium]
MKQSSKNKETPRPPHPFGQELWGVIFFVSGLFVLIALLSQWHNATDNILGPILGTNLAAGLIHLFGFIPSLILPALIMVAGIMIFNGSHLRTSKITLSVLFLLELSIMLAIGNLPLVTQKNFFPAPENTIGNLITFLLHYIFDSHTFGPYFIFSCGLFVTAALLFNFRIKQALAILRWVGALIARWLHSALTGLRSFLSRPKTASPEKQTSGTLKTSDIIATKNRVVKPHVQELKKETPEETIKEEKKKPPKTPVTTTVVAQKKEVETAASEANNSDQEQEPEEILDKELAAFRAKRSKPVTITTQAAASIEPVSQHVEEDVFLESEDDESDIAVASVADPLLLQGADHPGLDISGTVKGAIITVGSKPMKQYKIPSPDILPDPPETTATIDHEELAANTQVLEKTLLNFGVEGKVVNISPGPVVTQYEIELAPGVKISKVLNLHDDLSMAVGGKKIRIEAPIPGKAAVGIELPNDEMQLVTFKSILISDIFRKTKSKLPIIIGRSISGAAYITDIVKMPHLLIAGQTGSGKSVAINSFICSMLMTKRPDEVRLILIDPKKVEMSLYENIPHLLAPVVTESKEAVKALQWGVVEMTRRYRLLAKVYARNIDSFNQKIVDNAIKPGIIPSEDNKKLPFIVIVVDELADLMMTASRDVEGLIQRIAQLARAVGIHLLVATQRPSVDIITGPIKANLTSRIAFRTIQSTDSRTILGRIGAEKLLGRGDMLFLRNGAPDIERYHGAFISEEDVETIVADIKHQNIETEKIESFESLIDGSPDAATVSSGDDGTRDEKFEEAARLIVSSGLGSTSLLQRRLKLGYARAGRLMDELHSAGIVGPQEGSKPREILVTPEMLEDIIGG